MRRILLQKYSAVLFLLLVVLPAKSPGKTLRMSTLRWPPYVSPNVRNQGVVADVVKSAMREVGYEVKVDFLPWKRVLSETLKGKYHGLFPAYHSESRSDSFVYSRKILTSPLAFYRRKEVSVNLSSLRDLHPYTIGVVMGYMNSRRIEQADFLTREYARNDLINLRKLARGRIDLAIVDKHTARYLANHHLKNAPGIELVTPIIQWLTLHAIFPRKAEKSDRWRKLFDEGLGALRTSGKFDRILKRHGFRFDGKFFLRLQEQLASGSTSLSGKETLYEMR